VCLAAHEQSVSDGLPEMSNCYCHPGKAGGLHFLFTDQPYCASGERGKRQDLRYNPQIKRYYQRKRAKTKGVIATKAVAHKLARACYYILRDGSEFDVNRAFA
jgi:hypothetical protein